MMASIAKPLFPAASAPQMRPFDARRDLQTVADLIELGFSETLDDEGLRYLSQMRATATSYKQFGWLGIAGHLGNFSMAGYVWEEAGQLVGNLNLIPYLAGARRNYLIANVVVHPNYRRKGIGRALTVRAIEQARSAGAPAVWLHVRAENQGAIALYESLGFVERARRTTWISQGESPKPELAGDILIGPRLRQHWPQQRAWLQTNYPQELLWNLPLKINSLNPGLFGWLERIFDTNTIDQWAVQRRDKLAGVISYQANLGIANLLWLAAPGDADDAALQALLLSARRNISARRPLTLDYPAGQSAAALQVAGFRARQTLIWMEIKF